LDKSAVSFNIKESKHLLTIEIELNADSTMKELSYSQFGEQINKKYTDFLKEVNEAKNSVKSMK